MTDTLAAAIGIVREVAQHLDDVPWTALTLQEQAMEIRALRNVCDACEQQAQEIVRLRHIAETAAQARDEWLQRFKQAEARAARLQAGLEGLIQTWRALRRAPAGDEVDDQSRATFASCADQLAAALAEAP